MGFGPRDADVMVVSKMENSRTWQRELEQELEELGLGTDRVYWAHALKCRTFEQDASNHDVKQCATYLHQEIQLFKPKYILCLGNEALLAVTGKSGINKYRGRVIEDPTGWSAISTISPAAVKRSPRMRPGYLADLRLFVNKVMGVANGIPEPNYIVADTKDKLKNLKKLLAMAEEIYYDVETTGYYWQAEGRIISLAGTCIVQTDKGERIFTFALPLYHPESVWKNKHRSVLKFIAPELAMIPKVDAHNGSYDQKWMKTYGVHMHFTFDTLLGVHLLNENVQKGLKPQAQARLGVEPWGIDTKDLLNTPLDQVLRYNVLDTWYGYHVKKQVKKELTQQPRLARIFAKLTMPAQREFIPTEMRGMWLDVPRLKKRLPEAEKKLKAIEDKILAEAGLEGEPGSVEGWPIQKVYKTKPPKYYAPNFNASKFARWMLFDHLGLDIIERGKDKPNGDPGDPSMAEAVLLRLKEDHPVVPLMLERVSWQKTISSFFRPYLELYDENHRVHTNFKLFGTVTGRTSSGKDELEKVTARKGKIMGFNAQQVPRDPFVRGVWGAPPGWTWVEADQSQIELRLAAFLSRDPNMLALYKMGADIHKATASSVLGILESEVTKEDRKKAKAVNFGFVYGMGWRKFIETAFVKYGLIFTEEQARAIREAYFRQFPGLQPWHAKQRRLVREYGRVQSPIGRIRHLPDIYSPDESVQAEAERQAINSPVQSFGSDILLLAMIEINKTFRALKLPAFCVGTVHDAVNYEVRNDAVADALPIIKDTMQDVGTLKRKFGVHLDVPLIADLKVGTHWGDSIELSEEQVYNWPGLEAVGVE